MWWVKEDHKFLTIPPVERPNLFPLPLSQGQPWDLLWPEELSGTVLVAGLSLWKTGSPVFVFLGPALLSGSSGISEWWEGTEESTGVCSSILCIPMPAILPTEGSAWVYNLNYALEVEELSSRAQSTHRIVRHNNFLMSQAIRLWGCLLHSNSHWRKSVWVSFPFL